MHFKNVASRAAEKKCFLVQYLQKLDGALCVLAELYCTVLRSNLIFLIAGSLEAAYSLNWGAQEISGKGGGEILALL